MTRACKSKRIEDLHVYGSYQNHNLFGSYQNHNLFGSDQYHNLFGSYQNHNLFGSYQNHNLTFYCSFYWRNKSHTNNKLTYSSKMDRYNRVQTTESYPRIRQETIRFIWIITCNWILPAIQAWKHRHCSSRIWSLSTNPIQWPIGQIGSYKVNYFCPTLLSNCENSQTRTHLILYHKYNLS